MMRFMSHITQIVTLQRKQYNKNLIFLTPKTKYLINNTIEASGQRMTQYIPIMILLIAFMQQIILIYDY